MIKQYASPRHKRHGRLRAIVSGTAVKPRLSVFRSSKHMFCQAIDDVAGRTLASISFKDVASNDGTKTETARLMGGMLAERMQALHITTLVFDRGGYKYHGRVRALAEGLREKGLHF